VKDLTEIDFNQAVSQLKQLKRIVGEIADCTHEELAEVQALTVHGVHRVGLRMMV
jgi:hypothetical protein